MFCHMLNLTDFLPDELLTIVLYKIINCQEILAVWGCDLSVPPCFHRQKDRQHGQPREWAVVSFSTVLMDGKIPGAADTLRAILTGNLKKFP